MNSDYILVGDLGCVRKDTIHLVSKMDNVVFVNDTKFYFETPAQANKALAAILAQLQPPPPRKPTTDYRFFRRRDNEQQHFAVPSNGKPTGKSFMGPPRSDSVTLGCCRWSLNEMLENGFGVELTQAEFEDACGTEWRKRIQDANNR